MKKSFKRIVFGLVVIAIIAAIGLAYWNANRLNANFEDVPSRGIVTLPYEVIDLNKPHPAAQDVDGVPPQSPMRTQMMEKPSFGNMAYQFHQTSNFRDFIAKATQQPERGGYSYSYEAIEFCLDFNRRSKRVLGTSATNEGYETQIGLQKELERLTQACLGITDGEFIVLNRAGLINRGSDLHDPYSTLWAKQEISKSERESLINRIFENNDPYIFSLNAFKIIPQNDKGWFYDGTLYPNDSVDRKVLEAAFNLLPCTSGMDCSKFKSALAIHCAFEKKCYADYESLVLAELEDDVSLIQSAKALSARIAEDIRTKNISPFIPAK